MSTPISYTIDNDILNISFDTADLNLFAMPEISDSFWNYYNSNKERIKKVIFQLKNIDYIDSSALGFLVRTHIKLSREGVTVVLKSVSNAVMDVMKNSRLDKDFNFE